MSLLLLGAGGPGGAAAGAGEPPTLVNIQLWYDAKDADTLWADTTATTPASDGGTVARWDDKSGNGRNLTQSTGTKRPIWTSATGYLTFDGTDDHLSVNGPSIAMPITAYVVIRRTTGGDGSARFVFDQDTFVSGENMGFQKNVVQKANMIYAGNGIGDSDVWTLDTLQAYSLTYNGASSTMHLNGVLQTGASGITTGNAKLFRVGDSQGAGGGGQPFFGQINEILVYTGAHDQATREAFEAYLMDKWSIV